MATENIFNIPEGFEGNCEVALTTLNQCITDYVEYIASCATISELVIEANNNISGVTHVSCSKVDEDSSILKNVHEIADKIETKTQELVVYLASVKEYKHIMDTGGDQNALNDVLAMLQSNNIISFMADNNCFWIVDSFLKVSGVAGLSFIGSLMSYGTDATNEGGSFVVDGVVKTVFNKSLIWGAGAAAVFMAFKDIYYDEGNFTARDGARMGLDMLEGFALVGEWSLITNAVTAGATFGKLGCLGGPVGVVVASVAGVVTSLLLDTIFSSLVGDNVVYTAKTEDGTEIPIYANGNGKNGTYDVLIERANKLSKETFNFNGREYSYTNYKTMIYDNPEIAVDVCNENRHFWSASADETSINLLYEELAACPSAEEALWRFEAIASDLGSPLVNTCTALKVKGFDPIEYYTYANTGSIYGSL